MKTLLVIFGVTGDLSTRKLLPALSHIVSEQPELDLHVLGVSRREFSIHELIMNRTGSEALARMSSEITLDAARLSEYVRLKHAIDAYGADQTLIYLSVPPGASAQIVDLLGEAGINTPNIHLLFEKPFGFDHASAEDFIERTGRYFNESQLYRIDHYMAKEVAAEVIRLRESSESDHRWDNRYVTAVDIIALESVGIEGRSVFYEQTGALRDFVQGHLMQLLSLVLMDQSRPCKLEHLPERRNQALRLLQPADPSKAVRAQYEGYDIEAGNPGSRVETYTDIYLKSTDPRWEGVPIRLVTGKSMGKKQSAIIIQYRDGYQAVIDESMIRPTDGRLPDAYERVLLGAMNDQRFLFTTSTEILRSWELLAPIQEAWEMERTPLIYYETGKPPFLNENEKPLF